MGSSINNKDLYELVLSGKLSVEKAIQKSQQLRLDHRELAILCDHDLPESKPRDEAESEQPKTWKVSARGFPLSDGRGVPFKFVWAGRHAWTRDPKSASAHELTDSQMRDVQKRADRGGIVVLSKERIKQEQPSTQSELEQQSQPQQGKDRSNRR
jgi:hypothetical protein